MHRSRWGRVPQALRLHHVARLMDPAPGAPAPPHRADVTGPSRYTLSAWAAPDATPKNRLGTEFGLSGELAPSTDSSQLVLVTRDGPFGQADIWAVPTHRHGATDAGPDRRPRSRAGRPRSRSPQGRWCGRTTSRPTPASRFGTSRPERVA